MKKEAYGWGGDAYPGEEPDAVANNDASKPRQDYSEQVVPDQPIYYNWVFVNNHIVMDPERTPEQLVDDHGHSNMSKPLAYGTVAVQHRWTANFQIIHSNIGLSLPMKALKAYAKEQGWNDIGFVDHNGHEFGITSKVAADETWDSFNKSDPDSAAAFMRNISDIPGVRQFTPIPNHEIVHKPGDRVVMERAGGNAGTVLAHYPPGAERTPGYMEYMGIDPDDWYHEDDEKRSIFSDFGRPEDDHTYDVQWDVPEGYDPANHIGQMVEGHRLWPEGDVRLDMAYHSHVASDVGTGWQTRPLDWVLDERNPNSDQQDGEFFKNPAADKPRSGLYECPHCGEEMDNYMDFRDHLMGEKDSIATPNKTPDVAPIDLDKAIPADWNNSSEPDWVMMMSKTANTISVGAIPDDMMTAYRGVARRMGQQKYYGEGVRHQVNVEPFETNHPYHKDVPGVASFMDVFHQPDRNRIAIAYAHTDPSQRQQGHFKRLMQHVYDSYPDQKIVHGDRMHDASEKVFHEMHEKYPERTSRTAAPKVKLPGPIPFIFDIDDDRVYVGFPGEEARDVQAGDYNPLGIVEGLYKPTGEVEIQTQTNMPYTIRHMIQLWYYMHPELEVKSVVMIYEDGQKQKLAGTLPFVQSMALRPEDYEKWIATRGPYLWHWTKHENVPSILEHGLHPAERPHDIDEDDEYSDYDENDRPPNWGGFFETRPNHVYLAPPNRDDMWGASADGNPYKAVYQTPIQIDMRMLDPKKFKADEDRALSTWPPEPREEDYDTQEEFWDAQNAYDEERPPDPHQWSGESQTLGDWASEHGLDDPDMTWDSLQGSQGAIAYEGHIPPEALSHVPDWKHGQKEYGWEMDKREWEEPNPAWMPLFSHKTAMAIRPTDLDEWIKQNGPYMVHWTKPQLVEKIMNEGIRPWAKPWASSDPNMYDTDEEWEKATAPHPDGPMANWGGSAATRPGHVYMGTPDNTDILGMTNREHEAPFQYPIHVDLRKLDPTKFKADEDWSRANWSGLSKPVGYIPDPPYGQDYDRGGQSLGEWAEQEGLDDPDWVYDSLKGEGGAYGGGTVAYEGAIPPHALRHFERGPNEYGLQKMPKSYYDFLDQWKGDQGNPAYEQYKTAAMNDEVPPEPGTTPIPPNHVRLYHYTNSYPSFEAIKREGIKNQHAVGEQYGEPSQIWASTRQPPDHKAYFEFSMPSDDPRMDIGSFYPYTNEETGGHHTPETWAQYITRKGSDVTIPRGDIAPEEIIAAHEPWHVHYRYLQGIKERYPQDYEEALNTDWSRQPDIQDAVNRIKMERGKMAHTAAAPDNVGEQVRDLLQQDPSAVEVYNALAPLGNVYVVGGAIRDLALGRIPKDIDIMAQGISPDDAIKALELRPGRVEVTGNQFPVIRYFHPSGAQCEVALPRRETSTGGGGRKDFDVQMDVNMPVEEDLERRDFTGNSMAVDLKTGQLIDPYGGWRDLEAGKLKLVHPNAFKDDATRILRALSSKSRHGLHPDLDTQQAMSEWAHRIDTHVPAEQKSAELEKLMKGDDPAAALELAQQTGVLEHIIPELAATHGFDQKSKYHNELLFDHIMSVLRKTAELNKDPDVRMAAALHDIGKPGSQWIDDEGYGHYYKKVHKPGTLDKNGLPKPNEGKDHEHLGADLARDRLKALTWGDKGRQQRVEHLVRSHMFPSFEDEKGARKFLHKYDPDDVGHANDLLDIREADAGNKAEPWDGVLGMQRSLVQSAREQGAATNLSLLAINGGDVMRALDMKPGEEVGQALQYCQEIVLEDPSMNDKATLIEALKARANMKTAMADRSGIPEVDALIEEFLKMPQGDWTTDDTPYETLRDPERAHGACQEVTWHFVEFAKSKGFEAYATDTDLDEMGYKPSIEPFGEVGFNENGEIQHGFYPEHTVATIVLPGTGYGREVYIDFTASQYGYTDHPKVTSSKTANVLDPVQDTLDADVFDNADKAKPKVKPHIVQWVRKQLETLLKANEYGDLIPHTKLVMTGSLTSYQWSHKSDFDVSVWLDYAAFPNLVRAEMIALMVNELDGTLVPGTTHTVQCYIVPSGLTFEDLYKPGLRSAYDLDKNRWIVAPERDRVYNPYAEVPALMGWVHDQAEKMKLLQNYDPPGAREFERQIHERRRRDQQEGKGDFSESNVLWKYLEHMELV